MANNDNDAPQTKTSPDYDNYTRGVVNQKKNWNRSDIKYARRAEKGDSDSTYYDDPEGAAKAARKAAIEHNQTAKSNREWAKRYADSKDAYNKSDGGVPHFDDKVDGSFKKGGKVKKTGIYKVHKGERVLTAKQAKKVEGKKAGSKASKVGKASGMSKLMQSPPQRMKGLSQKKYAAKKQYGK